MEYRTSDIQLATLLMTQGVPFLRVEDGIKGRRVFVFEKSDRIAALEVRFWTDEIKVAPRKYMGAYKTLKNKLYNG